MRKTSPIGNWILNKCYKNIVTKFQFTFNNNYAQITHPDFIKACIKIASDKVDATAGNIVKTLIDLATEITDSSTFYSLNKFDFLLICHSSWSFS